MGLGWAFVEIGALSWSALCWDCLGRLAGAGVGVGRVPRSCHQGCFGGTAEMGLGWGILSRHPSLEPSLGIAGGRMTQEPRAH